MRAMANSYDDVLRRFAETQLGADLVPIEGGFHVKDLPDGKCVDVLRMIFNWRVVRTDMKLPDGTHASLDRGWCYEGTGLHSFLRAVGEAISWDGADDTEPAGWIKRAVPLPDRTAT
jgi:hypothetical protein